MAADDNATVKIDNPPLTAGGVTNLKVTVTAEDGVTKKTYTIAVTRQAPSTDCSLKSLSIPGVALSPDFSSGIFDYSAEVAYTVDQLHVDYAVSHSKATVVVHSPALVAGAVTDITLTVTAEDGVTQRTYTISVKRAPSKNCDLKSLIVSNATILPVFAPGTFTYTATVNYSVEQLNLQAVAADANATVQINNPKLTVGGVTNVTVTVTAQDGVSKKVYTIKVTRPKPPYPDKITSSRYTVGSVYFSKIPAGTSVATLLSGINERQYVKVYRANGIVAGNNDLVGTGFTVRLLHGSTVKQTLSVVVTGDVNGDGKITASDYVNVKFDVLGKTKLNGAYAIAADVNGDGKITATDYVNIKFHVLGKTAIKPR